LTIISALIVLDNASAEPYVEFRGWDAILHIGVAMIVMLIWIQVAAALITGVVRRNISAWWLSLLLWMAAPGSGGGQ
jgi:hypothetical protein